MTEIRQRRRINLDPSPEEVAAKKIEVREGFVHVQRVAYGKEHEAHEPIAVPIKGEAMAGSLKVVGSTTRNLGDYNSARVEVAVEVPCYMEPGEYRRAYEFATTLIDELIPLELEKAGVPQGE